MYKNVMKETGNENLIQGVKLSGMECIIIPVCRNDSVFFGKRLFLVIPCIFLGF